MDAVRSSSVRIPLASIPPLVNGDRLTRVEFERRYNAMPGINKAELIEGVVHMPSPVRIRRHSDPHSQIVTLLGVYRAHSPGTEAGDNGSLRLDLDNMPQPDAYLRLLETHGGHSRISEDDYLEGAPELIIEIAGSSAAVDLHAKRHAYRRAGVQEYVVWLTDEQVIRAMTLRAGEFVEAQPDADGLLKSSVFPGLWLNVPALLAHDTRQQLASLMRGIGSAEHRDFMVQLSTR
jgi:Uma2 family endonuclease